MPGIYNTNSQIKFKTSMLKSSLCHYSDAHILVKGTITVVEVGATEVAVQAERNNKQAILFTFLFHLKNSLFSRYLSFCNDFLVLLKKRLD